MSIFIACKKLASTYIQDKNFYMPIKNCVMRDGGTVQVVECLPGKLKALISNTSTE
jgi:hypothetical protein